MAQKRKLIFTAFVCGDFLFNLSALHLNEAISLLCLPLFLILLEIYKQKQKICNAQRKPQKFRNHLFAGIQQRGIHPRDIIEHIIGKRHQRKNQQLFIRLLRQLRRCIGNIAQKQHKNKDRNRDTSTVIHPFRMKNIKRNQPDPFAYLAAQICRRHRKRGDQKAVTEIQHQKKNQRQMHNQRVNAHGDLLPKQQKDTDVNNAACTSEPEQSRKIFSIHFNAEK